MHIILPDDNTLGDPLFVSPLTKHQTLTLLYSHAWLVGHAATLKNHTTKCLGEKTAFLHKYFKFFVQNPYKVRFIKFSLPMLCKNIFTLKCLDTLSCLLTPFVRLYCLFVSWYGYVGIQHIQHLHTLSLV